MAAFKCIAIYIYIYIYIYETENSVSLVISQSKDVETAPFLTVDAS